MYEFLNGICGQIEFLKPNGREDDVTDDLLFSYYFKLEPSQYYLTNYTKNKFLKNCDRSSEDAKIKSLYKEIGLFNLEMK